MLIKQACHDDWAKEDREFVKTHAQPVETATTRGLGFAVGRMKRNAIRRSRTLTM
jgi:hypothetical protein